MNLTLEEISNAVGGTLNGAGGLKAKGYSIDTRTIRAGDLFVAIKGPRFDGHDFVEQAFQKNAVAAMVEYPGLKPSPTESRPTIGVGSTVEALQTLAREVRRRCLRPSRPC